MKKTDSAMLFGGLGLLIGLVLMVKFKKTRFWWWVLLFLIIVPAFSRIGWAVGKETDEMRLAREKCTSDGKSYIYGSCI